MARLFSVGFETQLLSTTAGVAPEPSVTKSGTVEIDTTVPRSGAACAKCASGGVNYTQLAVASTLGRAYFYRFAFRLSALPGSTVAICRLIDSTGTVLEISVSAAGKLEMWNAVAAAHPTGEAAQTVETNRWYVVEMLCKVPAEGKGKVAWWLDGTQIAAEQEMSVRNLGINTFRVGNIQSAAFNLFTDDWALNDDQGASETGRCGNNRKVVMLKPVSDKARTGFTGGAGGTTNLFDAVNNTPPIGAAVGSGTDASQVKDANNNSTDSFEVNLGAYSASVASGGGGLLPADFIALIAGYVRGGQNSATARGLGLTLVSNPAAAEVTGSLNSETAAAEPTGWRTITNILATVTYAPTVEKGVQPVVKIRKSAATTDAVMADLVGLLVEYEPGTEHTDSGSGGATGSGGGEDLAAGEDTGSGGATGSGSGTELAAAEDLGTGGGAAGGSGVSETTGDGPTYRSVILEDKPLLYWRLNESGNTEVEDRSGHERKGEYRNEAALGASGALEGDPDAAVGLDEAKAGYVKGLSYDPFSGTKTFEIWAKRKAAHEKEDVFFGSTNGGTAGVYAYIKEGTDNIRLTLNGFGATATWEHAWPTDEAWVHVVFVINPSTLKATLYVNGVSKGEKTISAYGGTAGNVRISHDNATGGIKGAFAGWLDEFAIYEGELSAERVKAHYDAGTRAPAAPSPRCLFGADMDGDVALMEGEGKARADAPYDATTWNRFEEHAGRPVQVVHYSDKWNEAEGLVWDGFGKGASAAVKARGAVPMKSVGGPANVLADTAAGKYDASIKRWAEEAAAYGDTVLVRPWWEFNQSSSVWAWSGTGRTAEHVAAWRHLVDLVRPIAPNALFVWCPNVMAGGLADPTPWYPGDAYVDWTGMDGYSGQNPAKSYGWRSAYKLFKPTSEKLLELAPDKPIMIGETAASEYGGSKPTWIRNLLGEIVQEEVPMVRCLLWFNWNIEEGTPAGSRMDWPIESSPASQAAFKAGIGSSYYGNPLALTLEPADLPLPTRAILHGQVDPGGLPATYWFEWGETTGYGFKTITRALGPKGVAADAEELLKGLPPGRTHHFRLVAENEIGQVATADQTFTLARPPQLQVREHMPMDIMVLVTSPGGKTYDWTESGGQAGQVLEEMSDSGSVPGGNKDWSATLPRKSGIDYSDMKRGSRVEVSGTGQLPLGVYRLTRAPQISGDKISVTPAAQGYEGHLVDDTTAQEIFIDADQTAFGEPSARRRASFAAGNKINQNGQVSLLPAGSPDPVNPRSYSQVPAISHSWSEINQAAGQRDAAESWYSSNGIPLGQVRLDFLNVRGLTPGDVTWNNLVTAAETDYGGQEGHPSEILKDFDATSTVGAVLTVGPDRYFISLEDYFGSTLEGAKGSWETQWRNIRILGRHGLPVYGTWPAIGLIDSDVIAYVLQRWAPEIHFTTGTNGTIKPGSFLIPDLKFKEPTTAGEMIQQVTRFEIPEWGVWPGQFGPTFYKNPRGQREGSKRWRVRARDVEFEDTGQQLDQVYNGAVMQGQASDGTTIFIGPPGSGLRYTSERLIDRDPQNPANEAGIKHYKPLPMKGVATIEGMEESGEEWLKQNKLLDGAGKLTITGYVEDDKGKRWPYYCVEAGDEIEVIGSSIPGYRYIVNADRTRSSRSVSIDIDAPPDAYEAMMERLHAEYAGLGFGG